MNAFTHLLGCTVHKVLFAEAGEVACLEGVLPLQGAGGGKCPAGTADQLVLHRRHSLLATGG